MAALVLESWSGARGPVEAARAMGVALVRYYQLEARALQAVIAALEPRGRGRQVTAEGQRRREEERAKRLERELRRYQALYRSASRSLGLAPSGTEPADKKSAGKRRRRMARGERVARLLVRQASQPATADAPAAGA